ncbi:MAG: AAA family ATPase, partial [Bacteroidaceae bacterium]|nr:AAA family ATPase [Bacteroidaceae bacterium]
PGYVGYEEGGQLTERVRRKPYSIILFDEIEKAHPDVFNTLLQVMDEGRLTDGSGKTVDFKNTVIIMTSNSGTRQLKDFGSGIGFEKTGLAGDSKNAERIVRKALSKQFAPEFLNRLDDIIMFQPLNEESGRKIALLEIEALRKRMQGIGCELTLTDAAVDFIVKKGFDPLYGARSLKRAIQQYVEDVICEDIMENSEDKTFLMDVSDDDSLKVVKESSLPSESTTE